MISEGDFVSARRYEKTKRFSKEDFDKEVSDVEGKDMAEKKKVFIIVDMQNDFLTGALGNEDCQNTIGEVVKILNRESFDEILFTRDTHQKEYLQTREGSVLPVVHCVQGTSGWEICDEVMNAVPEAQKDQVKYFCKDTFGSVELGNYLKETYGSGSQVELYFAGVCTGICVISNVAVSRAFCPEAEIIVYEKACACVTPASHQTAIEAMKTFQVNTVTTQYKGGSV